jgi:hypothetical protein
MDPDWVAAEVGRALTDLMECLGRIEALLERVAVAVEKN